MGGNTRVEEGLGDIEGVGDGVLVGVALGTLVALGISVGVLVGTDIAVWVAVLVGVAGENRFMIKGRPKNASGMAIAMQMMIENTRDTTSRVRLRLARRRRTSEVRSSEGATGNRLGDGTEAAAGGEAGVKLAAQ